MTVENAQLREKLERVRVLLLDVDGVLTNGHIIYNHRGEESLAFYVRDGLGIKMVLEAGITVGIITGRSTPAVKFRSEQLGIPLVFEGIRNKTPVLEKIFRLTGVSEKEMAFIGDDVPDIGLMKRVGLAVAVADADELCRQSADMVTRLNGGRGAVREVCEAILKAQGMWEDMVPRFI